MRPGYPPARLMPTLALAFLLTATGCSAWTLAPGELKRAGQQVHGQARVMDLVVEAGLREHPPTVTLKSIVGDAAEEIAAQRKRIRALEAPRPRKATLLRLSERLQAEVGPLRSALDSGDRERLREIREDVLAIASRFEALGIS